MKIQFHRIDTNVVIGLLIREFCCSGTDVSAKVLVMYAGTRTPSMEPQWLAAGLSQHKIPGDILFNVTADGKIQITEGQDWKYENDKNVIEEVVDEAGNVIYLIRDVRNPEEEEETTVSETPTTTPSSERVILGIEDMSRTIGMALAGFGAIMLTALIWLYLRSKKA